MKDSSTQQPEITINVDATSGAAVYNKSLLMIYDFFVLGLSNTFFWKCPTQLILNFYNQHVSAKHLDVGVGSGYFLDKCQFPNPNPIITLVDLNPNALEYTAHRIHRYKPTTLLANIFQPLPSALTFDSIGLNYLLHCLSGHSILSKAVVFRNLKTSLNDGGIIFGTTILGKGVSHNLFAQQLMRTYNAKGIFGNTNDTCEDLETILKENFRTYDIRIVGCVAFFVGWK
ncbi:class I SAM-dependent methyltransferase [Nostoc sp.]|uniref:class I SAM-dependent methyltransferase n=1 Tax=Nostoc sp. TaxID=1180 RepID=UPI002FF8667F